MLYATKSEDAARLQITSGEEATKITDQHNSMLWIRNGFGKAW